MSNPLLYHRNPSLSTQILLYFHNKIATIVLDITASLCYYMHMLKRKPRQDRNHVLYRVECIDTGDSYIGLTVAQGQAYLRSVKVRWQKHMSRAKCENKAWAMCTALRELSDCTWTYQVIEVVRGRKPAHQRERQLISELNPTLNTF